MIDPQAIKDNQARMERDRSSYDAAWGEIARLVYFEFDSHFGGTMRNSNFLRNQLMIGGAHDPYTAMALQDGVSVFESYVMPRGQRWQKLELGDDVLMRSVAVQQWMEKLEIRLFGLRNDPESGFIGAVHESAMSLYSFGPQSMWVDDRWDVYGRWAGLRYESEFIGDIFIERDAAGRILRIHRTLELTAEAALRKWGEKAPRAVTEAMSGANPNPQTPLQFIHVIEPNRRYDAERIDMMGMPWHGCYYSCQDELIFEEGGYRSLPRIVSAWGRPGNARWGRSPSLMVLPLVRMAQQMMLDRTWAAELRLKPPFLTTDDGLDNAVLEIKPHGVTEGGLDDRGNPLVREFLTAADGGDARELTAEMRALIDRAFHRDLLQMNREYKSHIPAARIEEEKAEKGLLLAPLARQEQEWLSPMTQRELALMEQRGLMDDMPGEVNEYLAAYGTLGIRYDNGLSALQEASKSASFLSLAGQVGALAQFDPTYVEDFKREYPSKKVIPELGRIAGVPASMRATDEERGEYDRQKAEAQATEQLLAAVPALAGAAKDAAAASMPLGA